MDARTGRAILINKRERYYMAKAMDLFYDLPTEVQYQMLRFFLKK